MRVTVEITRCILNKRDIRNHHVVRVLSLRIIFIIFIFHLPYSGDTVSKIARFNDRSIMISSLPPVVIINLSFVYVYTSVAVKRSDAECSIARIHRPSVRQKCKGRESGETEALDKE